MYAIRSYYALLLPFGRSAPFLLLHLGLLLRLRRGFLLFLPFQVALDILLPDRPRMPLGRFPAVTYHDIGLDRNNFV